MSFGCVKLYALGGSNTSNWDTVCAKTDFAERISMAAMMCVFIVG